MFKGLRRLFYPHSSNNYKAEILHPAGLCVLIAFFLLFQSFFNLSVNFAPGVLGFASDITPEQIVELTNEKRLAKGITSLKINEKLSKAARAKAADMFALNYWAHISPRGVKPWQFITDNGYHYLYAGENLARDFSNSGNVITAWMNSPSHRQNLLSEKYKDIGVAVVDGVLQGQETTLIVQLFGTSQEKPQLIQPVGAETKATAAAVLSKSVFGKKNLPLLNSFDITKSLTLAVVILLFIVLALDGFVVYKKKKTRISGHNFIHGTFIAILIIMILLIQKGVIL